MGNQQTAAKPTPTSATPPKATKNKSTTSKQMSQRRMDASGWREKSFQASPYQPKMHFVDSVQRGVLATGKDYGLFVSVTLNDDFDDAVVRQAISDVPNITTDVTDRLELEGMGQIASVVAVTSDLWKLWDATPPTELKPFKTKTAGKTKDVLFPAATDHIFLFVRASSTDHCYQVARAFRIALGPNTKSFNQVSSFTYLPTKQFTPNMARDLSGFVDGTRNPDHTLRAVIDQVVMFPRDDKETHAGGSFMYAGRFIHNLTKFRAMAKRERDEVIGRDYDVVQKHVGADHRPENARLDNDYYRDRKAPGKTSTQSKEAWHTHRSHAAIYRQAMPYVMGEEEGLYFIAFARTISEFETALDRMAGKFQDDGSIDNLFKMTRAVTSNYYYCPSLQELAQLPSVKRIAAKKVSKKDAKIEDVEDDSGPTIFCEICTNCGYKTIYEEKCKVISSILPNAKFVYNAEMPRLACFEFVAEDGTTIFSKMALKDGMNNYPHCFPENQALLKKIREVYNIDDSVTSEYDKPGQTFWGASHGWDEQFVCKLDGSNK